MVKRLISPWEFMAAGVAVALLLACPNVAMAGTPSGGQQSNLSYLPSTGGSPECDINANGNSACPGGADHAVGPSALDSTSQNSNYGSIYVGARSLAGAGVSTTAVDAYGYCYYVNDGSTNSLFVPFGTPTDWKSFILYKPTGVTLVDCTRGGNVLVPPNFGSAIANPDTNQCSPAPAVAPASIKASSPAPYKTYPAANWTAPPVTFNNCVSPDGSVTFSETATATYRANDSSVLPPASGNYNVGWSVFSVAYNYNGMCGSADGGAGSSSAPSSNLCHVGVATAAVKNGAGNLWTWTCQAGNGGGTPASCSAPVTGAGCPANPAVTWLMSGNSCTGSLAAAPVGGSSTATSNGPNVGSALYSCLNTGSFALVSATCDPPSCAGTTESWTVGGVNCSGPIGNTANGNSTTVTSTNGNAGSAGYTCNGTSFTGPSGATCSAAGPYSVALSGTCTPSTFCLEYLVVDLQDGTRQEQGIFGPAAINTIFSSPIVDAWAYSVCPSPPWIDTQRPNAMHYSALQKGHIQFNSEDSGFDDFDDLVCDLTWVPQVGDPAPVARTDIAHCGNAGGGSAAPNQGAFTCYPGQGVVHHTGFDPDVSNGGTGLGYTWACMGGTDTSSYNLDLNQTDCSGGAKTASLAASCGWAANVDTGAASLPSDNSTNGLCDISDPDVAINVSGNNPSTWTCAGIAGGANASCTTRPVANLAGACGSENNIALYNNMSSSSSSSVPPTPYQLCSVGKPSVPTGGASGAWNWTCAGFGSGSTASCSAINHSTVDGQCGPSTNTCSQGSTNNLTENSQDVSDGMGGTITQNQWQWDCVPVDPRGSTKTCYSSWF